MSTSITYWTQEFVDAHVENLLRDPSFQKASRSFKGTIVLQCLGAPNGKDVSSKYHINKGDMTVDVSFEDSPSQAIRNEPFDSKRFFARTTAPYELWTKLDRGQINVIQAIASPDYRVEGPKLRIMANINLFRAMNDVAARMDKSY